MELGQARRRASKRSVRRPGARAVIACAAVLAAAVAAPPAGGAPAGSGSGSAGKAAAAPARLAGTGDLQVRVEWRDVPAIARRSPGRTPCNTPRAPSVAPTTLWGIPGALVVVDAPAPAAPPPAAPAPATPARITLADCALAPRIATGASLSLTSAADRPARLVLRKRGPLARLVAGDPTPILLPIAGHTVATALEPGMIYSLETDAPEPELSFISTLPTSRVTDASGAATLRDLPAGSHVIIAWLPPRAGQPARLGRGTATITAGAVAELTIQLAP